jgi:hypothetical protein
MVVTDRELYLGISIESEFIERRSLGSSTEAARGDTTKGGASLDSPRGVVDR